MVNPCGQCRNWQVKDEQFSSNTVSLRPGQERMAPHLEGKEGFLTWGAHKAGLPFSHTVPS